MSVAVIIVAAGRGHRMGADLPKQYLPIGPATSIQIATETFLQVPAVTVVVPVIHPDDSALCHAALNMVNDARLSAPVHGEATRALSVRAGLESLADNPPEYVLIHDAARPFIPQHIITDVIAALDHVDGAFAALPVVDALWQTSEGQADTPVARDGLWRAQTPQGFRYPVILQAHRAHDGRGADDVTVARAAGLQVRLIQGSEQNYKITTPADLERARFDAQRLKGTVS